MIIFTALSLGNEREQRRIMIALLNGLRSMFMIDLYSFYNTTKKVLLCAVWLRTCLKLIFNVRSC